MREWLREDLARFGQLARRRIIGYLALGWMITLAYLGCHDDLSDASSALVRVRGVQYVLCAMVFHIGLAAFAVLGVAAWKRAWAVVLLSAPVVAITVLPEVPATRLFASPAQSQRPITIFSVNVLMINRTIEPIMQEIEAARPDVVLVQEYAPQWHTAMAAAFKGWHYAGIVREDSFGVAFYSKIPFRGAPQLDVRLGTWDLPQARAVLDVGTRGLAVYNVHLVPPRTTEYTAEHRRQLKDLVAVLRDEKLPMVVSGDFNFTPRMPQATHIAGLGLIDAHQQSYPGRHSTWPVISFIRYLPGVALDHVFLSRDVGVVRADIGTGTGSDHRPLTAVLGVP
jgi:endonuclease/exonuclease/phosphatase (EEP) superfamily protein YafD